MDSFSNLNTEENTGKLLLAALSILSGTNFKDDNCKYGPVTDYETILEEIVETANYVYCDSMDLPRTITSYIDRDSEDGRVLETAIDILCSNRCKNGCYGGHEHVSNILDRLIEITKINNRNRSIDLII